MDSSATFPIRLPMRRARNAVAARLAAALACVALLTLPGLATAASTEGATRFPATGLAILDCAPPAPAPGDSCLFRLPAGNTLGKLSVEQVGTTGSFRFDRTPPKTAEGSTISTTLVLLDLSPGPGDGRKATWAEERRLVARLLRGLPQGEPVALYGFNEKLVQLASFTRDHAALASQVEGLELQGSNTRIATFAREAVDILGNQDHAILRNLVVITDGQEEGDRSLSEVEAAAVKQGVTIASLGMFWRPVGDTQNGAGMDFLAQLSEGTRGTTQSIELRRPQEAEAGLDSFLSQFSAVLSASGLILPEGQVGKADILVTLNAAVPGKPGSFTPTEVQASFVPVADRGAKLAPPPPVSAPTAPPPKPQSFWQHLQTQAWLGLALLWWAIGAAILVLALIVLAVLLLVRPRHEAVEGGLAAEAEAEAEDPIPFAPSSPADPAPAPTIAYLIRDDTGLRLEIRKARVTVGRGTECDIVLPDLSVSRNQCEIRQGADGKFTVRDSGSLNGTLLEGRALQAATRLAPGDRLTLGNVDLRFSPV